MKKLLVCLSLTLALTGCGDATGESIAQLHAKDAALRLHAVKALGDRTRDAARSVPALTEALQDQDAFVRRDAAHALGKFGADAKPASQALTTTARTDKNLHVRKAAADALKLIDPDARVARS
jgi:HEAT repeat protein